MNYILEEIDRLEKEVEKLQDIYLGGEPFINTGKNCNNWENAKKELREFKIAKGIAELTAQIISDNIKEK